MNDTVSTVTIATDGQTTNENPPRTARALMVIAVTVPFAVALVTWIGWRMNLYPGWFGYVLNGVLDAGLLVLTVHVLTRDRSRRIRLHRQAIQQLSDFNVVYEQQQRVLETIVTAFSDVIVMFDHNGRITYANEPMLQLVDGPLEHVLGADSSILMSTDGNDTSFSDDLQAVLSQGVARRGQFERIVASDARIYEYIINPLIRGHNEVAGAVCEARDITSRTHAEAALRRSEERFRAHYRNTPIPTYTWRKHGNDFVLIDCNDAAISVTDGGILNYINTTLTDFYRDDHPIKRDIARCAEQQRVITNELDYAYRSTDKQQIIELYFVPLPDDEVMIHTIDVTERRRAEQALRRSEQQLSAIIHNTPNVAIQGYDIDGRVQFWNPASETIFGFTRDEALGKRLDELVFEPEQTDTFVAMLNQIAQTREPVGPLEWTVRRRNGEIGTITSTIFPIRDQTGNLQFICMDVDITERTRAEQALRRSEQHLRSILDGVFAFIKLLSLDGRILESNRAPLDIAGLDREDILGKPLHETFWFSHSKREQQRVRETIQRAAAGQTARYDAEICTANGERMVLDAMFGPLRDEHGEIVQIVACAVDITRRKQAEQALRENRAQLQLMLDQMPAIVWTTDPHLRFTSSTGAGLNTLAVQPDDIAGQDLYEYFQTQDPGFKPIAAHYRALKGESVCYEIDWAGRSFLAYIEPLRDESENIIGCLGLAHDITEQKHAIGALRESEQRFRQLAEHINEVFWLTDWQNNKVLYVSPVYESIWGQSCQSLYDEPASWADPIHPDDRERVFSRFKHYAETGEYDEEYRIVHHDGSIRWIHDRAFPIHDPEGRVYRVAGLSEDITERKEEEQRRMLMLRELDHRVKNTLNAVLSIASQTGAGSQRVEEFTERFMGRVRAMARAHEMLARTKWQGVELDESIQEVLRPYLDAHGVRLHIQGDAITLPSDAATPVTLALNELATNAAKHGVFAVERGSLEITWQRSDEGVELIWSESIPDASAKNLEKGLGIRLIEGLITYQLHGRVHVGFDQGLRCSLYIPLGETARESVAIN